MNQMYESPITQILGEMQTQYENDCMKVVQQCGFDVNKEELIKALSYDRNQYSKGYEDGYNKAIDDLVLQCKKVHARGLITNWGKPFGIEFDKLDEIAQQLKEGGEE